MWRSRIGTVVVLAVLVAGGVLGWTTLRERFSKPEVAATEIRMISPAQAALRITATGYVVPQVTSKLGAGVLARVTEIHVKEGQAVHRGDLIARLEDAEPRARLAAARARSAEARAQLAEIRHQYDREKVLADSGATARSTAEDLGLRLAALEQSVRAAEAEAETLDAVLRQTTIRAPMDGVVIGKPAAVGELVGPGLEGNVAELADFATLVVESDVPEGRLHQVQIGGPTEIVLDAYPTKRFRGRVQEVSPRVNRSKATVVVKVAFVDEAEGVLPEMAARVGFLSEELPIESMKAPPKLFVPASAVVRADGGTFVFRIDDGKVRRTAVTLGPPMENGFELVSGPAEGTRVVANPPESLEDGQAIKEKSA